MCLVAAMALSSTPVEAQFRDAFQVRGMVGFSADGYTSTGIGGRRAPVAGQAFAATSFSLWGMETGFNLAYSTDGDIHLRQSMNRIGLDFNTRLGRVAAGDVVPSFSRYSISGLQLRGGMVDLNPGTFNVGLAGGRSNRATGLTDGFVSARGVGETLEQWLYAARLGVDNRRGSYFNMTGVLGRDAASGIEPTSSVAPAENTTLSTDAGIVLLNGRVTLQAQLAGSAFTRDVRMAEAELDVLPFFFEPFFTSRAGSRFDLAGEGSVRLNLDAFSLTASFDRVQPGFYSMGLPHLRSDQQSFRVQPRIRLLDRRVNLGLTYGQARNNLLGAGLSTFQRTQMAGSLQARVSQAVMLSGNYSVHANENQPSAGAPDPQMAHQKHLIHNLSLTPVLTLQRGSSLHNLVFSGSYQTMLDRSSAVVNGTRDGFGFESYAGTLSYNLSLASGLAFSAMANAFQNNRGTRQMRVAGVNVGSGYGFFERALRIDLMLGLSATSAGIGDGVPALRASQWTSTANATYRLPNGNSVRASVRGFANQTGEVAGTFREATATLRYEHRF
jgi:hypothetical protein